MNDQDHEHGKMDITEQERTFEGFIKFWIYLFGFSAAVLIFLAIFNS
ncbi:MAG: aa3-type cytochrome c oxidase subunit IV [Pseudomonadota bacterium]